jgi:formate--tetrahydrofolate ligase
MSTFDTFVSAYGPISKVDAYGFLDSLAADSANSAAASTSTGAAVPRKHGKVVLVTADTPLKASRGEGKTTATVALTDALRARGIDATAVLRQPSMGITAAGSKGGASGGGKASLKNAELADWGLFGEMMRIATAQNLIVSLAEKALEEGKLTEILLPRVSEVPSKALRKIAVAGGNIPEKCVLSPTSEMMQIVTLSKSMDELATRIGAMIVGTLNGKPVKASELTDVERIVTVLGDAVQPAVLETEQGSPIYMHCGPFANVSIGIPSLVSVEMACARHDIVFVEAGYGADMGAQKWLDIASREFGAQWPVAAIVVTRASTWRDDPSLQWRYPFHIQRLENVGIPSFPLLNLWEGEDDQVPSLRAHAKEQGFREPIAGNLFRDGSEALVSQLDEFVETVSASSAADLAAKVPASTAGQGVMGKLKEIIAESYGVPADRVMEKESFTPSLAAAAKMASLSGFSVNDLAVVPVKSPATMTDDDTAESTRRTVTLKKVEIHAGAGLLHVNLTTSLTTAMPKIV